MSDMTGAEGDGLTKAQVDAVIAFQGYGNPAGAYWFIGIEERGTGSPEQLRREVAVRAKRFRSIEDLSALEDEAFEPIWGKKFSVGQHVPTWAMMSKIVLRLEGDPDWQAHATQYQAERLGRTDGDTFLTDLLPLPKASDGEWPYPELWPTVEQYREEVLPQRVDALRTLLAEHRPTYVFCYGVRYWTEYQRLFPEIAEYEPIVDGSMQLGRTPRGTLVALTPFFAPFRMSHDRIDRLARRLREDRFTWHDGDTTVVSRPDSE